MSENKVNPNELIYLALSNDEEAWRLLFEQLSSATWHVYHRYCSSIMSRDEWEREAMLEMQNALLYYREREGTEFRTVYCTYLKNRARRLLVFRKKGIPEGVEICPIETTINGKTVSAESVSVRNGYCQNVIEDQVISYVACDQLLEDIRPYMTEKEMKILSMVRQGYRRTELCRILKVTDFLYQKTFEKSRNIYRELEKKRQAGQIRPAQILGYDRKEPGSHTG